MKALHMYIDNSHHPDIMAHVFNRLKSKIPCLILRFKIERKLYDCCLLISVSLENTYAHHLLQLAFTIIELAIVIMIILACYPCWVLLIIIIIVKGSTRAQ